MVNHQHEVPALYKEFVEFKSKINQFTDYLVISEEEEPLQYKRPMFFSPDGEIQRIEIPY